MREISGGVKGAWESDGTIFKNTNGQRRGQYQRKDTSSDCSYAGDIMGELSSREMEIKSGVEGKGQV